MLYKNNTVFLEDGHFRVLFDNVVYSPWEQTGYPQISIVESSEENPNGSCSANRGKWRFMSQNWDYTCGIYDAIETVRQAIFFAKRANKNSVEIALVNARDNPDHFYFVNLDQQKENYIDLEKLKKRKVFSYSAGYENCDCYAGVSKKVFEQVLEPALHNLMHIMGFKVRPVVLKNKIVSEKTGIFSSMFFRRDLPAMRIEWGLDPVFSPLPLQPALSKDEVVLQAA